MTTKAKLLVDECIPPATIDDIRNLRLLSKIPFDVQHTNALGFGGEKDEVWVPKIARQDWIVVSGDRGSKPKRNSGAKLPAVCRAYGVTHVLLSASVNGLRMHQKLGVLLCVWDDLVALKDVPPGGTYQLQFLHGTATIVLKEAPLPESEQVKE